MGSRISENQFKIHILNNLMADFNLQLASISVTIILHIESHHHRCHEILCDHSHRCSQVYLTIFVLILRTIMMDVAVMLRNTFNQHVLGSSIVACVELQILLGLCLFSCLSGILSVYSFVNRSYPSFVNPSC
jgi:hypothetical protein